MNALSCDYCFKKIVHFYDKDPNTGKVMCDYCILNGAPDNNDCKCKDNNYMPDGVEHFSWCKLFKGDKK